MRVWQSSWRSINYWSISTDLFVGMRLNITFLLFTTVLSSSTFAMGSSTTASSYTFEMELQILYLRTIKNTFVEITIEFNRLFPPPIPSRSPNAIIQKYRAICQCNPGLLPVLEMSPSSRDVFIQEYLGGNTFLKVANIHGGLQE